MIQYFALIGALYIEITKAGFIYNGTFFAFICVHVINIALVFTIAHVDLFFPTPLVKSAYRNLYERKMGMQMH